MPVLSLKVTDNGDALSCHCRASEDDRVTVEYYINDVLQRAMTHERDTPLTRIFHEIETTFSQIV